MESVQAFIEPFAMPEHEHNATFHNASQLQRRPMPIPSSAQVPTNS